jgi:hypothetical protein
LPFYVVVACLCCSGARCCWCCMYEGTFYALDYIRLRSCCGVVFVMLMYFCDFVPGLELHSLFCLYAVNLRSRLPVAYV